MLQQSLTCLDISSLFHYKQEELIGRTKRVQRYTRTISPDTKITLDCFTDTAINCCFVRILPDDEQVVKIILKGSYRIASIPSGGWLLEPQGHHLPVFWIPQPPCLREIDANGRILSEMKAEIIELLVTDEISSVDIKISSGHFLDLVIWRIPPEECHLVTELTSQNVIENQTYFIYASHTSYTRLADIYLYVIDGSVFGNNFSWPRHRKICDELDAYALYLIMSALGYSTGKQLYSLVKWQIVFSTLARQDDNGRWSHGEWTDFMESHHRLHCGGIHLLLLALEEEYDDAIRDALDKAVTYLLGCVDNIRFGVWFLHDSLETSVEQMQQSPFSWHFSRALGKSPSNMFVLNTHMDILIALWRYQTITGDMRSNDLIESGKNSLDAVMNLRPAEFIYKWLFKAISLTLLPEEKARSLPLPVRAIKRLAWKYLMPGLHYIKAYFPRLVMPGGYIDRALSLKGAAFGYQSVHVWDMSRYLRYFPDINIEQYFVEALNVTHFGPLRSYWRDPKKHMQHALGFWVEALYHLCMRDESRQYRAWLSEAMLDIEDIGLGQPPSLLGVNAETSAVANRYPCPSPTEPRLRIANLSRSNLYEILVVNPTDSSLPLQWQHNQNYLKSWQKPDGQLLAVNSELNVPPRGWLLGCSAMNGI